MTQNSRLTTHDFMDRIRAQNSRQGSHGSARLSNAEMNAPTALLGGAVHDQAVNRIELVAEVKAHRTDGRPIAQTSAEGVAEILQVDGAGARPDVAGVHERHAAESATKGRAQFRAGGQQAVAADRQALYERAHFVAAPPPNTRRAAEKVLLRKRHQPRISARGVDFAELHAVCDDEALADRRVVPA